MEHKRFPLWSLCEMCEMCMPSIFSELGEGISVWICPFTCGPTSILFQWLSWLSVSCCCRNAIDGHTMANNLDKVHVDTWAHCTLHTFARRQRRHAHAGPHNNRSHLLALKTRRWRGNMFNYNAFMSGNACAGQHFDALCAFSLCAHAPQFIMHEYNNP